MNLEGYYLDMQKLEDLKDPFWREKIYDMYRDMLYTNDEGRSTISKSLFSTLTTNGYLKSVRDDKIQAILDGDNSIGS